MSPDSKEKNSKKTRKEKAILEKKNGKAKEKQEGTKIRQNNFLVKIKKYNF